MRKSDLPSNIVLSDVFVPPGTKLPSFGVTAFFGMRVATKALQTVTKAANDRGVQAWPITLELLLNPLPVKHRLSPDDLREISQIHLSRSAILSMHWLNREAMDYVKDWLQKASEGEQFPIDDPFAYYNRFTTNRPDLVARMLVEDPIFEAFGAFAFDLRDQAGSFWSYATVINRGCIEKAKFVSSSVTVSLPDSLKAIPEEHTLAP